LRTIQGRCDLFKNESHFYFFVIVAKLSVTDVGNTAAIHSHMDGATTFSQTTSPITINEMRRSSLRRLIKLIIDYRLVELIMSVVLPKVIMLSVVLLGVIMLSVAKLSVNMLTANMLSIIMLSVFLLSIVILSIIRHSVVYAEFFV
jgi:hypothetical protein